MVMKNMIMLMPEAASHGAFDFQGFYTLLLTKMVSQQAFEQAGMKLKVMGLQACGHEALISPQVKLCEHLHATLWHEPPSAMCVTAHRPAVQSYRVRA